MKKLDWVKILTEIVRLCRMFLLYFVLYTVWQLYRADALCYRHGRVVLVDGRTVTVCIVGKP